MELMASEEVDQLQLHPIFTDCNLTPIMKCLVKAKKALIHKDRSFFLEKSSCDGIIALERESLKDIFSQIAAMIEAAGPYCKDVYKTVSTNHPTKYVRLVKKEDDLGKEGLAGYKVRALLCGHEMSYYEDYLELATKAEVRAFLDDQEERIATLWGEHDLAE